MGVLAHLASLRCPRRHAIPGRCFDEGVRRWIALHDRDCSRRERRVPHRRMRWREYAGGILGHCADNVWNLALGRHRGSRCGRTCSIGPRPTRGLEATPRPRHDKLLYRQPERHGHQVLQLDAESDVVWWW